MGVKKQPTIYDVAQKAGVSTTTVSRVMNEPSKVAVTKRQAVLDAIRELNFIPKADALMNARKTFKKIGVVAPFFNQPSFMERLRGVTDFAMQDDYELVLYAVKQMESLTEYIDALVTANRVDGLIFFSMHLDEASIRILNQASFPVCCVEEAAEGFDSVLVRNLEGGQKAAEYFYNMGCRKPSFIGEASLLPYATAATEDRYRGFRFFFESQGVSVIEKRVWIGECSDKNIEQGIKKVLSQEDLPDCVFCSSDVIAACFMRIAKKMGICIPGEIKLLGFDDIDMAGYIGLSSVSQSLDLSGRVAAELIIAKIKNPERPVTNIMLPLEIIERESTKK